MKTVTNKDVVVGKFLQKLITHLFGKGDLYHFEWEEECVGHCKAIMLVSFSLTHAIQLEISEFFLGNGQAYGIKGWTEHCGAGQFIKVSHKETGAEIKLTHWGRDGFAPQQQDISLFLKKLGLN